MKNMENKSIEILSEENLKKIEEHLDEIVRLGGACRLSREELMAMVEFSLEEYE